MTEEEKLFQIARSFIRAGLRCEEEGLGKEDPPLEAAIVCYAFATECLVKCVIVISGKKYKQIHSISKLIEALPTAYQNDLQSHYRKISGRSAEHYKADVAQMSNNFIDWRYKKAGSTANFLYLKYMHKALWDLIERERPKLIK